MLRLIWLSVSIFALLASAAAPAQSLAGWQTVLDTIQNQAPSQISQLTGKEFDLTLSDDADKLEITPVAPFELEGSGNRYKLKIVNASALLVNNGGIYDKVPLAWSARIGGAGTFALAIEGIDECLFSLTFKQTGGDLLKLTAMRADYDVTWQFNNPGAIASADLSGDALQVRRASGDTSDVSVKLRLKSKTGNVDVSSKPVTVQKCAKDVVDSNGDFGVIQIRTPGQCVVQTSRKEDRYDTAKLTGVNFVTAYKNTCDKGVKCSVVFQLFRHNSVADGIARINGTRVANGPYQFSLSPGGEWRQAHYLETTAVGYPYYTWSDPWMPDAAFPGWDEPDLHCTWS